ncbi:hypothetical protein KCP76_26390 (plasmid) [Salmonella enterica subsp. enterica serovar Weltevreden]|nr:hypothetical protein KCP76_26390 [Salmonella enterica subsp. enterica serovar Weltevreden]
MTCIRLLKAGKRLLRNICEGEILYGCKENIIDKLRYDYDFIFLDSGHSADVSENCIGRDLMLTPLHSGSGTFHSS